MLLVHGSGTYSETFEALPADLRLIAYERRGFGASERAPASRFAEHVPRRGLLEALDAAPATIVGSSVGGVIALRLAVDRPELVSASS